MIFFLQKQLTILFSYFTMKTVLFYPTFLLQNYAVRKGEASLVTQLEDTQAQHCDLLVKQNKKYKTDEETYSYPSGQVIPS